MASTAAHRTLRSTTLRACVAGAAAFAGCIATAAPAAAAAPAASVTYTEMPLPAGMACDFDVLLEIGDDGKRTTRELTDSDGNAVILITGAAETDRLTNVDTGKSVTIPARGARTRITTNPDGSQTFESTGNLLLILFETDPGGDGLMPTSTTLISGRTVFTVGAEEPFPFTVQSVTGKTTDICAALAS